MLGGVRDIFINRHEQSGRPNHADHFAYLSNCASVDRGSDSMSL